MGCLDHSKAKVVVQNYWKFPAALLFGLTKSKVPGHRWVAAAGMLGLVRIHAFLTEASSILLVEVDEPLWISGETVCRQRMRLLSGI